jgi:hypothetical protein
LTELSCLHSDVRPLGVDYDREEHTDGICRRRGRAGRVRRRRRDLDSVPLPRFAATVRASSLTSSSTPPSKRRGCAATARPKCAPARRPRRPRRAPIAKTRAVLTQLTLDGAVISQQLDGSSLMDLLEPLIPAVKALAATAPASLASASVRGT